MCGFIVIQSDKAAEDFAAALETIRHRGPDNSQWRTKPGQPNRHFGFNRLAIMDPTPRGDQPFTLPDSGGKEWLLVANGEIYNYDQLAASCGLDLKDHSDCEVLLPLFQEQRGKPAGMRDAARQLDGEFAMVFYDGSSDELWALRDHLGIRPMFYGLDEAGRMQFASEAKALMGFCTEIKPFPPGYLYSSSTGFVAFTDSGKVSGPWHTDEQKIRTAIRDQLTDATIKRLKADRPVGFLLSGGLDSSLVCAIAARHHREQGLPPIKTFAIGNDTDAIDLRYARIAADYIGSDHTEFMFSRDELLESVREVIYHLESWDTTTVRASLGMYLLVKAIRRTTDVKVLLTGETSDELFGYKYTDFAPSGEEFQLEAAKRIRELYLYDALRADRCIAAHGIEARVPFSDRSFVEYVMAIAPELKRNLPAHSRQIGKRLLREAFVGTGLLPDEILLREKAAFSDGVGHSMVDWLKALAEERYSDAAFAASVAWFGDVPPPSKEALMYREIFASQFPAASGSKGWIPGYWLPNAAWPHCAVSEPSARVLPNYGASGD